MTEFDDVIRLLREQRPEATPLELDQIKQRVRRSAEHGSRRNQPMKSRLAILGTLVVGMLFTTSGAGLAVTSLSTGESAGGDQYGGVVVQTPTPTPAATATPVPTEETEQPKPQGGVQGEEEQQPAPESAPAPAPQPQVQPARQVEVGAANTNELPFTGFAAIPVMLIGIALLTTGLVLRRRSAGDRT